MGTENKSSYIPTEIPKGAISDLMEFMNKFNVKFHEPAFYKTDYAKLWIVYDDNRKAYILKRNLQQDYKLIGAGELKFGKIAEQLGVGPKIYGSVECEGDESFKVDEYILYQKLSGPNLNANYPYRPIDVIEGLDLYYKLLNETKLAQNDLHGDNLVSDEGRWFLIDYGLAQQIDASEIETYMKDGAGLLLFALEDSSAWKLDSNDEFKAELKKQLQKEVDIWLMSKFGSI